MTSRISTSRETARRKYSAAAAASSSSILSLAQGAEVIGGFDQTGPRLFETEPSGALAEYTGITIGKGKKEAMHFLEKNFKEGLSFDSAISLALKALEKGLGDKGKFDINRLDFAFIEKGKPFERISAQKLKSILGKK